MDSDFSRHALRLERQPADARQNPGGRPGKWRPRSVGTRSTHGIAADLQRHLAGCRIGVATIVGSPASSAEHGSKKMLEIGRAHAELQSLMRISYAVFCLKKKKKEK